MTNEVGQDTTASRTTGGMFHANTDSGPEDAFHRTDWKYSYDPSMAVDTRGRRAFVAAPPDDERRPV